MKQMLVAFIMCVVGSLSALGEIVTTFWDGPMLFQVLSEEEGTAALIAPTEESMDAEYLQGMTKITVPSTATDSTTGLTYRVEIVGVVAFSSMRASVEEVVISEGIKEVYGFIGMPNLRSVVLPNSVETLWGFRHVPNLKELKFPDGLQSIGPMSFWDTGITQYKFPESMHSIDSESIWGCDEVTEFSMPGIEVIGDKSVGTLSKLKKLVLPACLRRVYWEAVLGNMEEIWFETDGTDARCVLNYDSFRCRPKVVYCARPLPPEIGYYDLFVSTGGENRDKVCYSVIFGGFAHMQNVKLYVPVGYGEVYRQHRFWGAMQVQEYDFDAGVAVSVADVKNDVTPLYDLLGRNVAQVDSAPPGIYVRAGRKHLVR